MYLIQWSKNGKTAQHVKVNMSQTINNVALCKLRNNKISSQIQAAFKLWVSV